MQHVSLAKDVFVNYETLSPKIMFSKDGIITPFDSKCLINMSKTLSYSSLLQNQTMYTRSEVDNINFKLLTDFLAAALDKMFVV